MSGYDAVVLAGGSGRRLGGVDKAALDVGGAALLARVLAAVEGAERTVCVGPVRGTSRAVVWCREEPPGGGPVAALAAAQPHLHADVVVVLAVDLPFVEAATVRSLAGAGGAAQVDGAIGVDVGGKRQPLLAAYRRAALVAALAGIGTPAGASMRALTRPLRLREVPVGVAATDCDTADDLAAARAAAERS